MNGATSRGAARVRSRKRLSDEDIKEIADDLKDWSKSRITWGAVVLRVEALLKGRRFSRQALEAQDDIYAAYTETKIRLRDGVPSRKRKPLAERLAALEVENRELRAQNDVLAQQFVTWLFNAESYGVRADQLNEPMPVMRLPSDVKARELKRKEQQKEQQLARAAVGKNTLHCRR